MLSQYRGGGLPPDVSEVCNFLKDVMEALRPTVGMYLQCADLKDDELVPDAVRFRYRPRVRDFKKAAALYDRAAQLYCESPAGEWSRTTVIKKVGGVS